MTWRFVSAKILIRYFSNSSKLVERRAQRPVSEVKILAVRPSIPLSLYCCWESFWDRARCSTSLLEFEKYLITPWIVLHSVQLPLLCDLLLKTSLFQFFFLFSGWNLFLNSFYFCKKPGVQIQVDCSTAFAKTIPLLLSFSLKQMSKDLITLLNYLKVVIFVILFFSKRLTDQRRWWSSKDRKWII